MEDRLEERLFLEKGVVLSEGNIQFYDVEGLKDSGISLGLVRNAPFKIEAYPGPEVVKDNLGARREHLPLHFHVYYDGKKYRIKLDDFGEYDGNKLPRRIRIAFGNRDFREFLVRNTRSVFETGKMIEGDKRKNYSEFII